MCSVHEKKLFGKKSESGFVLIAALMGIMILLAVGYFALTVSTGDLRIAARLVGERKAFSAAESGVHELCRNFNPMSAAGSGGNVYYDPTNDPTARYSYAAPARNNNLPEISPAGYDLTKAYLSAVYDTVVTGEDTGHGSKAQIAVGTAAAPNPTWTQQGGQ